MLTGCLDDQIHFKVTMIKELLLKRTHKFDQKILYVKCYGRAWALKSYLSSVTAVMGMHSTMCYKFDIQFVSRICTY